MSVIVKGGGGSTAKELVNSTGAKLADLEKKGSGKVSVVGGLGGASPADVLSGKTFTSESGVRQTGTFKPNTFKPYPVTGITIETGDKTISLKWTDPTDEIVQGINLNEWVATELIMNENHMPANRTDGVLKYTSTTRNAHKSTAYKITGLTNDKTYYFALFPKSKEGIYNEDPSQTISGKPSGKWAVIPSLANMTPQMLNELAKDGYKSGNNWMVNAGGTAKVALTIGQTKNIKLTTGETITMVLADLNHDDLTSGGKAPFTFIMKDCLNATRSMNSSDTNSGGWKNSGMRSWCNGTFFNQFPAEWRNGIKQVNKKGYSETSSTLNTTADKLWLLAEIEAFGTNHYSAGTGEGTVYPIFTNDTSRAKKVNGSASWWWLRSPRSRSGNNFCCVRSGGSCSNDGASYSNGVAVGFCI